MLTYGVVCAAIFALSTGFVVLPFTILPRAQKADSTVVLSHVLFRHGNRTPEVSELYPKDPYLNYTYYPYGRGQLTNAGKRREYSIGEALRGRYEDFLGQYYIPEELDARSTDRNRTKASLLLALASLYAPRKKQVWRRSLDWQPVPYNYVPERYDAVLYGTSCPTYKTEYASVQQSDEVQEEYKTYKDTFDYIAENSGLNVTTYEDVYNLYFGLSTEEEFGLALPRWTRQVWPATINEIAYKQYYIYTKTPTLKKMAAGYLLQKIINDSQSKATNQNDKKLYLYSAHENNIGQMLATLDLFEYPHVPTYGTYLIFEIHLVDGVYGVKIYYQNYETAEPKLLKLAACEEFCPVDSFKELVAEYLPEDGLCGS
ncbi:venom acid phosphatase Acph-1-like [Cylas formicarius]|uniref:venom acid phosphatase Acph-1-like n=1 Tax=Cylas formicarius TaxID=197179 RepID=UPI0029586C34|nr:venom acid phosphatase Acph-1-like [Cylas formicarius]